MTETSGLPEPHRPISDREREMAVEQIQRAMAQGMVEFEELDDRFEAVYAATTQGELEAVYRDLPLPPPPKAPPPAHPIAPNSFTVFGDTKVGGWISVGSDVSYGTVFGDVVVDLSSANLQGDCKVRVWTVFGNITVILPDGVRATLQTLTIFGSRKEALSPPVAGMPYVQVFSNTVFGEVKMFSLSLVPEGKLRKLWKALRSGR